MKLKHVFSGRTTGNDYFWFVLFEDENGNTDLVLTMPELKVTQSITEHFCDIEKAYLELKIQNKGENMSQIVTDLGKEFNYEIYNTFG